MMDRNKSKSTKSRPPCTAAVQLVRPHLCLGLTRLGSWCGGLHGCMCTCPPAGAGLVHMPPGAGMVGLNNGGVVYPPGRPCQ
jgi:hypothetical protein